MNFEWFYTRDDGGANQVTPDLIVVSGGSRLIRINLLTLGVGSFTYFARQKESGVLITPVWRCRLTLSNQR